MLPTTDHVQSVHQRKVSADGLGFRPLEDLQRCVDSPLRWNRRTGTHRPGAWALLQGAVEYPVQRDLAEAENGAQDMIQLRCPEQADCSLTGAEGFWSLDEAVQDNPVGTATI